jgi:signal peptidase I
MTDDSRLRRLASRAADAALTVGAVVGLLFAVVALLALVLDLRVLTFRSGSMSPAIGTGALAVTHSVPAADLRTGDVVSVRTASGNRVTHRIVDVEHSGRTAVLELRGDANKFSDAAPYTVTRADRVWFDVPLLGYAAATVATPAGLVLLGLYASFLLRVLFARRTARPVGKRRASRRGIRRGVRGGAAAAAVLLGAASVTGVVAARSSTTLASWTDAAATSGSVLSAGSVPAPATFSCGLLGILSVTFNWSAVAGATSYTVHYGSGGAQTTTVTGTSTTITAAISGGTAWVTANRNYGATTWTSTASGSRSYAVALVSLCS